jgi:hypothetical protein
MQDITLIRNTNWFFFEIPTTLNGKEGTPNKLTFINDSIVLERCKPNEYSNGLDENLTVVSYYKNITMAGYECLDLFYLSGFHYTITQEEIDIYLTFQ